MYCPNCGNALQEKTRYCPGCGSKKKKGTVWLIVLFFCLFLSGGAFSAFYFLPFGEETASQQTASDPEPVKQEAPPEKEAAEPPRKPEKQELKEEQKRELTDIIADAQETVYTVFTSYSQGSGFLYNDQGAVVTNAHVVEGEINVYVKTVNGTELPGKVVGYSNETDIAVIHVPELAGKKPFPIEKSEPYLAGEEVIALGSPLGYENTATMGYITGTDRNFVINTWIFNGLYQISAPISPGSSGGPLLSKSSEKIIAVNSAKDTQDTSIGFSIPIYNVANLIDSWIDSPMSEEEIYEQFYGASGRYFFEDLWSYGDWYFEGGYYSEEDYYYDYWEYGYYDFWEDYGYDYWDYYWDENYYYDDWYDSWFEDYEEWDSEWHDSNYGYEEDWNYDYDEEWNEEWEYEYEYDYDYNSNDEPYEEENYYYEEDYNYDDENWHYNYDEDLWYYFDEYEGIWYYYDEITDQLYEVTTFENIEDNFGN